MATTYQELPQQKVLERTAKALTENGITTKIVENGEEAKNEALSLLPKGAEVMTMTSVTLDSLGLTDMINTSGDYNSVKTQLSSMDREKDQSMMQKLGAAPDYAIGSNLLYISIRCE